jgi:tRNA-splicing ligase RtcB
MFTIQNWPVNTFCRESAENFFVPARRASEVSSSPPQRDLTTVTHAGTPAGSGVLGIIPGTMADPAFLVQGRGEAGSLRSASHGAGRRMSRTEARKRFTWDDARPLLAERGVELISGDLDEVPMAYKDIPA